MEVLNLTNIGYCMKIWNVRHRMILVYGAVIKLRKRMCHITFYWRVRNTPRSRVYDPDQVAFRHQERANCLSLPDTSVTPTTTTTSIEPQRAEKQKQKGKKPIKDNNKHIAIGISVLSIIVIILGICIIFKLRLRRQMATIDQPVEAIPFKTIIFI